jgi:hypothetical protein
MLADVMFKGLERMLVCFNFLFQFFHFYDKDVPKFLQEEDKTWGVEPFPPNMV